MPSTNSKALFHSVGVFGILVYILLFFLIFVDF